MLSLERAIYTIQSVDTDIGLLNEASVKYDYRIFSRQCRSRLDNTGLGSTLSVIPIFSSIFKLAIALLRLLLLA